MIGKAQDLTPKAQYPNVEYQVGSAESLPFLEDESVDMVVAAQAAHWFDYPKLFPELKRVLRKQGTVAFWGYKVFFRFHKRLPVSH
jgi:ubiquinone/menaquinone biosynthesis C-methylase UbiE